MTASHSLDGAAVVDPRELIIHTTYRCPLTCSHCCFHSGPSVEHSPDYERWLALINAIRLPSIESVVFTGGEPFLLGGKLDELINAAKRKRLKVRIVTSAYWAKTLPVAEKRLSQLKEAGLDQLSISWDDFHQNQSFPITFEYIRNASVAALSLGIDISIYAVCKPDSYWNTTSIKAGLGSISQHIRVITDLVLNKTGRAAEAFEDADFGQVKHLGPCPLILRGPTLNAHGNLQACCGVTPQINDLIISTDSKPSNINELIVHASKNSVFLWLYLRGPHDLLETVYRKYNIEGRSRVQSSGNCHSCSQLFENKEMSEKAKKVAADDESNLTDELRTLKIIGLV